MVGEAFTEFVAEHSNVTKDVGLVDVGSNQMDGVLEDAEHFAAKALGFIILTGKASIFLDRLHIVGDNLATAVFGCGLAIEGALEFEVAEENAIDKEGDVRTYGKDFFAAIFERVTHFFGGGEYVFLEVFVATEFRAGYVDDLEGFALEGDGFVAVEEDGYIGGVLQTSLNLFHQECEDQVFIPAVFLDQVFPLPG